MKIGFASDHRGLKLKRIIMDNLKNENYELIDYGTYTEESSDYPDYAFLLGENIVKHNVDFGVAICGSGIGISIACNKVKGIRCAKVDSIEEAKITRNDNDSNIIAFGEKTDYKEAIKMIKAFITTPSSNEEKHKRRINKITEYEEKK